MCVKSIDRSEQAAPSLFDFCANPDLHKPNKLWSCCHLRLLLHNLPPGKHSPTGSGSISGSGGISGSRAGERRAQAGQTSSPGLAEGSGKP